MSQSLPLSKQLSAIIFLSKAKQYEITIIVSIVHPSNKKDEDMFLLLKHWFEEIVVFYEKNCSNLK